MNYSWIAKPSNTHFTPARPGLIQRLCACGQHTHDGECEDCKHQRQAKEAGGLLQRAPASSRAHAGTPNALSLVRQTIGEAGHPLDPAARAYFEPRFGQDFSQVRVHTGLSAGNSSQAVNAQAYTVGSNIVFGTGQYAPHTSAGQALLAHELTHVVQQGARPASSVGNLELGAPHDSLEGEAQRAANAVLHASSPLGIRSAGRPVIQRAPLSGLGLDPNPPILFTPANIPVESIELGANESITAANPKLVRIAEAIKSVQSSNPDAKVELSAYLSESSSMSTTKQSEERARLVERMSAIRDVLQALGVAKERISFQPPTAFATSASGQVAVDVYKARKGPSPLITPAPLPVPGKVSPAAPKATPGTSLSDLLTLKYGPLTVELPKSLALKIPIPISAAKSLIIDLKAEVPGTFSFSITIDGLRYVRVAAKAGVAYDKDKGVSGSAGLQIELTRTVCNAPNPEALRAKITAAGEKLTKAMQEYSAEADNEKKLGKLADVASALGEMYDAVDKSKSSCKPVPAATFEFGVKGPLGSGSETDPNKRDPSYIGGTLTIPF